MSLLLDTEWRRNLSLKICREPWRHEYGGGKPGRARHRLKVWASLESSIGSLRESGKGWESRDYNGWTDWVTSRDVDHTKTSSILPAPQQINLETLFISRNINYFIKIEEQKMHRHMSMIFKWLFLSARGQPKIMCTTCMIILLKNFFCMTSFELYNCS